MQRPSVDLPQPDSHEPERLPRPHDERDGVNRLHLPDFAADHAPALDREVLRDRTNVEQRLLAHRASSGWIVASRRARFSDTGRKQRSRCPESGPLLERRPLGAGREDVRAAGREGAAGRQGQQRRRQTGNGGQPARLRPVDARDRAQQPPGLRMLRVREQLAFRASSTTRPAYITHTLSAIRRPRPCRA